MGISTEFYILYGFLAFMSVMLAALTVAVIRLSFAVGRLDGQLTGLTERVGRLEVKVDALEVKVDALAESTQRQIGDIDARVTEIRTLIFGINDRINSLMRHRHDGVGREYIIPEETPAD